MANPGRHMWRYRPGELVIAAELPDDKGQQQQAHAIVGREVEKQLAGQTGGALNPHQRRPEPIVFNAPGRPPLGFLFYDLAEQAGVDTVKSVVTAVHAHGLAGLQTMQQAGIAVFAAMPHWLGGSFQDFGDGSPASLAAPAVPPGDGAWRYSYTPQTASLDLQDAVGRVGDNHLVPVLVLDTAPDWAAARSSAERFATSNPQLRALVDLLSAQPLPDWHAEALRELGQEGMQMFRAPHGPLRGHLEADHGLFVAGLIHDIAPRAEVSLRPVLNAWGVGDLHLLLRVLAEALNTKSVKQPLVVNLSLGYLPHPQYLHWIWFGVDPPDSSDIVGGDPVPGQQWDRRRLASHRDQVEDTRRLLDAGVERLTEYLLANNCLAVAAAGNDSMLRVEKGQPRLGPRVPARYRSVLGVAATTADPGRPAAYSNTGDELELGDHISTFGGDMDDAEQPLGGVVGLYTAERFTDAAGNPGSLNETGFAAWSGTSFATALASGMVANYWASRRADRADTGAEVILAEFNTLAESYAPALRTPSIGIKGEWLRAP